MATIISVNNQLYFKLRMRKTKNFSIPSFIPSLMHFLSLHSSEFWPYTILPMLSFKAIYTGHVCWHEFLQFLFVFCLSVSFLKYNFAGYLILVSWHYSLNTLNIPFHSILAYMASDEKPNGILVLIPL